MNGSVLMKSLRRGVSFMKGRVLKKGSVLMKGVPL